MSFIVMLVYILLSLALIAAVIRLIIGKSLPDRVVALEFIASVIVGFVGVYAVYNNQLSLLDVAVVIALMAFLGAIGFARFIERGGKKSE